MLSQAALARFVAAEAEPTLASIVAVRVLVVCFALTLCASSSMMCCGSPASWTASSAASAFFKGFDSPFPPPPVVVLVGCVGARFGAGCVPGRGSSASPVMMVSSSCRCRPQCLQVVRSMKLHLPHCLHPFGLMTDRLCWRRSRGGVQSQCHGDPRAVNPDALTSRHDMPTCNVLVTSSYTCSIQTTVRWPANSGIAPQGSKMVG